MDHCIRSIKLLASSVFNVVLHYCKRKDDVIHANMRAEGRIEIGEVNWPTYRGSRR